MTFASSGLVTATAAIINQTAAQAAASVIVAPNMLAATTPVQNQYFACGGNSGASGSLAVPVQGVNENPAGRIGDAAPQGLCNMYNIISQGNVTLNANTVYASGMGGPIIQATGAGYTYRI